MLVDSHCHLDYEGLSDKVPDIVRRAGEANVGCIVTVGISKPDFGASLSIAEAYPSVYCCLGVHPHEAEKEGQAITLDELKDIAKHPKVIGIGETGLDYYYEHSPREAQERVFRLHLRACIETGLPVIIHTRDAEDDTIRILQEERKGYEDKLRGVLHCFSSQRYLADYAVDIGFYVSLSGMLTFAKSQAIQETAKAMPADRLLIETDAPFLAPVPLRGKTCEPAFISHTAAFLAKLRGVSPEDIEKQTTDNFYRLFTKAKRP